MCWRLLLTPLLDDMGDICLLLAGGLGVEWWSPATANTPARADDGGNVSLEGGLGTELLLGAPGWPFCLLGGWWWWWWPSGGGGGWYGGRANPPPVMDA